MSAAAAVAAAPVDARDTEGLVPPRGRENFSFQVQLWGQNGKRRDRYIPPPCRLTVLFSL